MFPNGYEAQMQSLLGEAGFFAYQQAMTQPPQRALRVNLLRCPDGALPCPIAGVEERVPWAQEAYFLQTDARPGLSPLHEGGLYYLQEPSALSAVAALAPQPGERILDLCAAPGGKSTQIAARMGGRGLLVSNELIPSRAQILSRNIERMGVPNAIVTSAAPGVLAARLPEYFDRVLVDAPCSGEGMFRRHPEARDEWNPRTPQGCADRQVEILADAARMVRPGGTLTYATCTFNNIENEGVVARFLAAHADFEAVPFALPGLAPAVSGFMHLYPHEIRGEGHFIALFHRRGEGAAASAPPTRAPSRAPARGKAGKSAAPQLPDLQAFLADGELSASRLHIAGDCCWALPEGDILDRLAGVRVLRSGLLCARSVGARWTPDHALAMALRPEQARRSAALTLEQAAAYQAGEALMLGDLPDGYTLLHHAGVPLGWGKQAGGQMKNHYPKGLRRRG